MFTLNGYDLRTLTEDEMDNFVKCVNDYIAQGGKIFVEKYSKKPFKSGKTVNEVKSAVRYFPIEKPDETLFLRAVYTFYDDDSICSVEMCKGTEDIKIGKKDNGETINKGTHRYAIHICHKNAPEITSLFTEEYTDVSCNYILKTAAPIIEKNLDVKVTKVALLADSYPHNEYMSITNGIIFLNRKYDEWLKQKRKENNPIRKFFNKLMN